MREMRDSGVAWIGEIPEEWSLIRFKDKYKNSKEIAGEKSIEYQRLALTLNGVVQRPKNDSDGLQPKEFDTYQVLHENDFVFKMIDLQNISTSRVGLSPYTGLSKLFEPGTDGNRKSLEKHHLFPKAYLKSLNCTDAKINQMANYALIDWKDNMDILDDAPSVYYPIICAGMSDEQIRVMEEENALPHGWENMSYDDFLIERRKLMAAKIKIAFEVLKKAVTE